MNVPEIVEFMDKNEIEMFAKCDTVNYQNALGIAFTKHPIALEKLEEWPSEKAKRLMQLLEVKTEEELNNLVVDGDYIIKIDNKLNEGVKVALSNNSLVDLKGFNRKEVEVLTDITTLLKDRLKDDKTKDT